MLPPGLYSFKLQNFTTYSVSSIQSWTLSRAQWALTWNKCRRWKVNKYRYLFERFHHINFRLRLFISLKMLYLSFIIRQQTACSIEWTKKLRKFQLLHIFWWIWARNLNDSQKLERMINNFCNYYHKFTQTEVNGTNSKLN